MTDRVFWRALKELIVETTKLIKLARRQLEKELGPDD